MNLHLIFLSLIGIGISFYLYYYKTHDKKIFCVIGQDCNAVVKSRYGKTFGMENTLVGMLYYALILVYGSGADQNLFKEYIIYYSIVIISIASVLFGVYLAGIQAFVLKKWCDYCIASSIVSLLILLALIL